MIIDDARRSEAECVVECELHGPESVGVYCSKCFDEMQKENEELKGRVHELGTALMSIEDHFSQHSAKLYEDEYRDIVKHVAKKGQDDE